MAKTRLQKYGTFAQQYCHAKYKHPAIYVRDVKAKIGGKEKAITVAQCGNCGYAWVTTHSRLKRLLKTHGLAK